MSKLLGSSPLGLAFFSGGANTSSSTQNSGGAQEPSTPGGGNSRFIDQHKNFTNQDVTNSVAVDKERTVAITTDFTSTPASTGGAQAPTQPGDTAKKLTLDYGLGYQTFGDKRTIFTDNDKMPRTFYAYYNRQDHKGHGGGKGGMISLIDYITSTDTKYYNSNYIDRYSSISAIIKRINEMVDQKGTGGAQSFSLDSIKLKYSDFAYLKKLGVYPSNRMIVARRFAVGVGDDLLSYKNSPLSVVPSWIEDGKNFVDINFSEVWNPVTNVDLGASAGKLASEYNFGSDEVSKQLGKGLGIFSLPGFTEWLQYYLFENIGITDPNNLKLLPTGNPNIIRKSMTRPVFEPGAEFSGLNYTFTIDINNEYEIKYIDGVDPTLIYFDIISNLLSFGTSESQFQFDGRFSQKARDIIDNLSSGDFNTVMTQLGTLLGGLLTTTTAIAKTVKDFVLGTLGSGVGGNSQTKTEALLSSQIKKYRIKFLGIINALTGSPSGIYHVTIGNPLRPLFASGDLIPEGQMKITLGAELGYNNLPTTIKFSCKLKNARPCGLQEIYKKFSPAPIREAIDSLSIDPGSVSQEKNLILSSNINRPRTTTSSPVPVPNFLSGIIP
jgi:hypothetical protein